jgi:[ribosomal protein S18]-alanine N-acetyltransferase
MLAPADDVDRIMAIMARAFDPAFGEAWNRRQVEESLLVGNCHYVLVDAQGGWPAEGIATAGFCLSRAGYQEEELLLLAVDPALRSRGLGRTLLQRFGHAAAARGAEQLLLEMRQGNPAETLYRSFGFLPVGERKNYYRAANGERFNALTFLRLIQNDQKT